MQVVAHRGSSAALPEHTLAAYRRALAEGADAVECDVRVTADGQLVCVHDRTIERVSDGGRRVVSALTLEQLRAYDFGSWKHPEQPEPQPVLTLESLLELVADAGRRVDLAIETKHPVRFRGRVETELVAMLRRFGIAGAVGPYEADGEGASGRPHARIMSFSGLALGRVRRAAPEFPGSSCSSTRSCCGSGRAPGCRRARWWPGRASSWCAVARSWSARCGRPGTGCTCGRWTSRPMSSSAWNSAFRRSSPIGPARCWTNSGAERTPGAGNTRGGGIPLLRLTQRKRIITFCVRWVAKVDECRDDFTIDAPRAPGAVSVAFHRGIHPSANAEGGPGWR